MIQAANASDRTGSPIHRSEPHADILKEARQIIDAFDAADDPTKVDRLASHLMMRLNAYDRGREFGLGVIAELRSEARRLGFFPESRSGRGAQKTK